MSRRRRRDESGSVLPIVAVTMVVLLGFSAFAVDLGMQRVARRDMQALADIVALDLARLIDGRGADDIKYGSDGIASLESMKAASVARNTRDAVGEVSADDVTAVLVDVDANGSPLKSPGGDVIEATGGAPPDAVYVTATTTVRFGFAAALGVSSGSATRWATASSRASGCFKLGSWLAQLSSTNPSVVGTLVQNALGGSVDLTGVGYEGLADASVSLLDLVDVPSLAVGDVDQLAAVSISLGTFLTVMASALDNAGKVADADIVAALRSASSASALSSTIHLGDLISASNESGAALATELNVQDMLTAAILVAGGTSLTSVPADLTIPEVAGLSLDLDLIAPPQVGCGAVGAATAATAQSTVQLSGAISAHDVPLPGSVDGLSVTSGGFTYTTSVSRAVARLTGARCLEGTADNPDTMAIEVGSVGAEVRFAVEDLELAFAQTISGLGTVHLVLTVPTTSATTWPDSPAETLDLYLPPNDVDPASTSFGLGLGGVSVTPGDAVIEEAYLTVLGSSVPLTAAQKLLPGVTSAVSGAVSVASSKVVSPLARALDEAVRDDLPDLIGLNTTGADVFGVPRPSCSTPVLVD